MIKKYDKENGSGANSARASFESSSKKNMGEKKLSLNYDEITSKLSEHHSNDENDDSKNNYDELNEDLNIKRSELHRHESDAQKFERKTSSAKKEAEKELEIEIMSLL